jgi:hypothetical protein
MSDMDQQYERLLMDLRDRVVKMETIFGNENRGVLAELDYLKTQVTELKVFQIKIMTAVGALSTIVQLVIQHFFSK